MELESKFVVFIPMLIALLGILKKAGFPTKYIPIVSILSGLIIGFGVVTENTTESLVIGFMIGLSAIGTHSGIKNTLKK